MVPNALQVHPSYVIPPSLGFVVLLCLAAISLHRGKKSKTHILFAAICLLGALFNADMVLVSVIEEEALALRIDRIIHLFFVFSIPLYIRFVHVFLGINGRRWLEITAWLFSFAFMVVVPTDLYFNGLYHYPFGRIARAGLWFHLFSAAVAFTVTYCLILLYAAMRSTEDNHHRNRIKYIFGGLGGSALLLAFTILPVSGIPLYPLGNFSFIPAIFLAFGVLKYDLLDMGVLIRRGTVYILLTGILTALYILIVFVFHSLFLTTGTHSLVLSLVMAMVIVLLFNPLRESVQNFIDRLFFRGRYDYRHLLREISGRLANLLSLPQIRALLIDEIAGALQVERVLLVLAEADGGRLYGREETNGPGTMTPDEMTSLINLLEGKEGPLSMASLNTRNAEKDREALARLLERLGTVLVIPLRSPEGMEGIIALGQRKSGQLFVDEDLELLTTIANQATTAIANAKSYEALASLNRDLEVKVAKRTAALREALSEKERTQELLIRSESLAAIGQLVAGTAHELNNPISAAMSLIESSVKTISDTKTEADHRLELLDDLRFSQGELRRAAAIIRSLLDLSRQTQTYVEPVDINRALDDALRILHNRTKHLPVVIEKFYDPDLPAVEGNFANLGQVWINIIENALEALPQGKGRILLTTRYVHEKNAVIVICRDSGQGIATRCLKDIFKPFFTTKSVGRGTGLGLYISHEIIRRHAGRILVESEEGRGTTVTVEIPCTRREP